MDPARAPPTATTPPPPPTAAWRGDLFDTAGVDGDPRDAAYFNRVMRGGTACLWGETQAAVFGGSPRAWSLQLLVPMVTLMTVSLAGGVAVGILYSSPGVQSVALAALLVMVVVVVGATTWLIWLGASQRHKLRMKYGIPGTVCDDCTAWSWWGACAAAQKARTVRVLEEGGVGGVAGHGVGRNQVVGSKV